MCRMTGDSGVSDARALPLLAHHFSGPVVVPPSVAEEVLALDPGLAVAGLHEGTLARLVLHERARRQLVEVQLPERVFGAERHRLAAEALTPRGLVADDGAGRTARVEPVDPMDPGRADRAAAGVDHPEHVVLRRADPLEEVLLLIERDGHHATEVARDLHVGEPVDETRRIGVIRG